MKTSLRSWMRVSFFFLSGITIGGWIARGGEEHSTLEIAQAKEAKTPAEIEETLARARRFFEGGGFSQARAICQALLDNPAFAPLPPLPPPTPQEITSSDATRRAQERKAHEEARIARQNQRETAMFLAARSLYEMAGSDPPLLQQAIGEFSILADPKKSGFLRPLYAIQAAFWMGRAHLRRKEPFEAALILRRLANQGPEGALEGETLLFLAEALQQLADSLQLQDAEQGIADTRARQLLRPESAQEILTFAKENPGEHERRLQRIRRLLREEAIAELSRFAINYPQNEKREEAELRLIELQMDLGDYAGAEAMAKSFLNRALPRTEGHARARVRLAEAMYWQGEIERAAEEFEAILTEIRKGTVTPSPATLIDLHHGRAWASWKLAQTASPEQRREFLLRARSSFLAVLASPLPLDDPRRNSDIYTLAETHLALGENHEALTRLTELLDDPRFHTRASYLAAQANRGLGRNEEAAHQFASVLRGAMEDGDRVLYLEALRALASLEQEDGAYAEALGHEREAAMLARILRDYTTAAEAEFGAAQALAGLGKRDESRERAIAQKIANTLARLTTPSPSPADLCFLGHDLACSLRALHRSLQASPAHYDLAMKDLQRLRSQVGDRLRKDALDEAEALALSRKIQDRIQTILPLPEIQEEDLREIFTLTESAVTLARTGIQANPRGPLAPRLHLLTGKILADTGRFALRIAELYSVKGNTSAAAIARERGRRYLQEGLPAFRLAAESGSESILLEAETQLAESYFDLEEYEEAGKVFADLVHRPNLPASSRIHCHRRWARALAQRGRLDEAVSHLVPYLEMDPEIAIEASQWLEKLQRPAQARAALVHALAASSSPAQRSLAAEAAYRLHLLDLTSPTLVGGKLDPELVRQESALALARLATEYPDTPWSGLAVLALGEHLLPAPPLRSPLSLPLPSGPVTVSTRWEEVLAIVSSIAESNALTPETIQALHLTRGRAFLEGKQYEQALEAFRQAEMIATDSETGYARRAAAVRGQGDVARAKGDEDEALRYYARVWAVFHRAATEADLARLTAAEIYEKRGQLQQARALLEKGSDAARMQPHLRRLVKKIKVGE